MTFSDSEETTCADDAAVQAYLLREGLLKMLDGKITEPSAVRSLFVPHPTHIVQAFRFANFPDPTIDDGYLLKAWPKAGFPIFQIAARMARLFPRVQMTFPPQTTHHN